MRLSRPNSSAHFRSSSSSWCSYTSNQAFIDKLIISSAQRRALLLQFIQIMQLSVGLEGQKLRLIIVSDIHLSQSNLQRLFASLSASKEHFDYCLVAGDIANCDNENKSHNEQEMIAEMKACLAALQDSLQCKVLWIPGNHDPIRYFEGQQHQNESIVNLHKRQFVLESGLRIVGLGGSLPAFGDLQFSSLKWKGYPYRSEEEYEKDLAQVFHEDQIRSSKIYLTHVGPSESSTTVDRRGEKPVYAGSRSLNLYSKHEDMLLLVHGHVHNGGRYDIIQGKPIINPGALLYGEYAVVNLSRKQKVWTLTKVSFEKLQ